MRLRLPGFGRFQPPARRHVATVLALGLLVPAEGVGTAAPSRALDVGRALAHSEYLDGPPPAHTGGFGEPTCRACHFEHPLNDPPGSVEVVGLSGPGLSAVPRELEVVLRRPDLRRAGFQLAFRFLDGPEAGRSAGRLLLGVDGRTVVSEDGGVDYLHHHEAGTEPTGPGEARWSFAWTPPPQSVGPVVLHVVANAANDDLSEFGDRIYQDSLVLEPLGEGEQE